MRSVLAPATAGRTFFHVSEVASADPTVYVMAVRLYSGTVLAGDNADAAAAAGAGGVNGTDTCGYLVVESERRIGETELGAIQAIAHVISSVYRCRTLR